MSRKPNLPRSITIVGPLDNTCRTKFGGKVVQRDGNAVSKVSILQHGALIRVEFCFADVCNLRTLLEDLQAAHADAETALEAADLEG